METKTHARSGNESEALCGVRGAKVEFSEDLKDIDCEDCIAVIHRPPDEIQRGDAIAEQVQEQEQVSQATVIKQLAVMVTTMSELDSDLRTIKEEVKDLNLMLWKSAEAIDRLADESEIEQPEAEVQAETQES